VMDVIDADVTVDVGGITAWHEQVFDHRPHQRLAMHLP
jgi:hypothetical protein